MGYGLTVAFFYAYFWAGYKFGYKIGCHMASLLNK